MRPIQEIKDNIRFKCEETSEDGGWGFVTLPLAKHPMVVVFSYGGGWEHVSASYNRKTPTWEEMCRIKDIFWHEDECVIQYHPAKEDYINCHPHCLHLWKPIGVEIPKPPKIFVGI